MHIEFYLCRLPLDPDGCLLAGLLTRLLPCGTYAGSLNARPVSEFEEAPPGRLFLV